MSAVALQLAPLLRSRYNGSMIVDPEIRARGREAYNIFRKHAGQSSRFYEGVTLPFWEDLNAISQESWVRYVAGLPQEVTVANPIRAQREEPLPSGERVFIQGEWRPMREYLRLPRKK
jgi:hypothetical protein